ncbi:MAG: hypothetical protein CYPHOPRED_004559, partial [Cyphobasidiales sp. Tagirdzhanova-0007]
SKVDGDKLAAFRQDTIVERKKCKGGKKKEETSATPIDADIDEDAGTIIVRKGREDVGQLSCTVLRFDGSLRG